MALVLLHLVREGFVESTITYALCGIYHLVFSVIAFRVPFENLSFLLLPPPLSYRWSVQDRPKLLCWWRLYRRMLLMLLYSLPPPILFLIPPPSYTIVPYTSPSHTIPYTSPLPYYPLYLPPPILSFIPPPSHTIVPYTYPLPYYCPLYLPPPCD